MRARTGVILVAAGAVGAWGWQRRRRHRYGRLWGPLGPLRLAALLPLAQDDAWSLLGIFDTIWGWVAGSLLPGIREIIHAISEAVSNAISAAVAAAYDWTNFLHSLVGDVGRITGDLVSYVIDGFRRATDFALWAAGEAARLGTSAWEVLGDPASWVWDQVRAIAGGVGDVFDFLTRDVLNFIYADLVLPLYNRLSDIRDSLFDSLREIAETAIGAALDAGSWLWDRVGGIVADALDVALAPLRAIVAVVEGAWSFLVWVAEHPISWFTSIADEVLGNGSEWLINHVLSAVEAEFDTVEQRLSDYFS